MEDDSSQQSATSPTLVTIKAVYCPGSSQEEIRRFNYPLPSMPAVVESMDADQIGAAAGEQTEQQKQQQQQLFDDFRRRLGAAFAGAAGCSMGLSLYYVDADQERVRFSTGDELRRLLRLHHSRYQGAGTDQQAAATPLRIIAAPTPGCESDGAEHPGVLCDGCNQPVRGRRFRCFLCPDFDLCQRCVLRGVHDQHSMLVLHRPGDADSLPPWLCRGGLLGGEGSGGGGGRGRGPWSFGGGWGGRFGHGQQQQQQQQPHSVPPHLRHYPPHGGPHMPPPPPPPPPQPPFGFMPQRPPMSVACPKLARKLEKARCKFEVKMAKRCEKMQRKWAWRQQMLCLRQQQRQAQMQQCQKEAGAAGTADEPIRIDVEEQCSQQQEKQQQQQQQQQQLTPEEALLLKQLRKRQQQAKKKQKQQQHHRHHKRGRGGRKRRRSQQQQQQQRKQQQQQQQRLVI
ncbi:hypothetical protein BOX15_Mlig024250g2 [Macrostomum lignano]|uniref:ZZ-type domain-containing protein n=1 Tax=Macrostomum lignano TaxID=282301 RepID=A0A267DS98_9PLAT|nr:hypothetical protein BOX15_Mlig024250g2 [Macrostomum lignano]